MPDDLRLPVLVAAAVAVLLLMALARPRVRSAPHASPIPVWRANIGDTWTDWQVLHGNTVFDRAVADLVGYCLRPADVWPDSANVAYHAVLITAQDQSPAVGVQFAIVRAERRSPARATEVLFMSPVHEPARV